MSKPANSELLMTETKAAKYPNIFFPMTCLSFFFKKKKNKKKPEGTSAQSVYVNIFFLYKAKEGEGQRRRKEEADFPQAAPSSPPPAALKY